MALRFKIIILSKTNTKMKPRRIVLSVILITILILTFFSNLIFKNDTTPTEIVKFDSGDTAWMIVERHWFY